LRGPTNSQEHEPTGDLRRFRRTGLEAATYDHGWSQGRGPGWRHGSSDPGAGEKGVAIDINGETESVSVIQNELRETRAPLSRIGILIAAETRDIRCVENRIQGFAIPISDLRKR
jgi:hypothetical protein